MDARTVLLIAALRHRISEPNIEAGFERVAALAGRKLTYAEFCDAVAECLREGLIREPIRLPEGALQCHWHLELTPKGVSLSRAAGERSGGGDPRLPAPPPHHSPTSRERESDPTASD